MNIPIENIYYLLCYAWNRLEEKDTLANVGALDSTDLLDLFARVLVPGVRRLLRRGLDRGYLPQRDEIAGVRGKLLVTATLRGNLLRFGRSECEWDELEYDTLPNRILKNTLQRLHDAADLDRNTRNDVVDLLRWFAPIKSIELQTKHFRRIQLHRNNRIYEFLLHICEFIHEHWLPEESGSGRKFREFERKGLHRLFEKFIFHFCSREMPDWKVSPLQIKWKVECQNDDAKRWLPLMKTDVCLEREGRAIIVDAKFYAEALKAGQYGSEKLISAHLYQLYTYLRQQSTECGWEQAEGILIYPYTNRPINADFTTHGHRIRAMTLNLAQPWSRVAQELMQIVNA